MTQHSAGVMPFRRTEAGWEVFLVHPGGPYWARKDDGAWSIAKGELLPNEEPLSAAVREFREETGFRIEGPFVSLGEIRQSGGKRVEAFAAQANFDPTLIRSNTFELEWPPRSGKRQSFPEVDRAAWFPLEIARARINPAQAEFLTRLAQIPAMA